jgi:chromosome segregation ATPase
MKASEAEKLESAGVIAALYDESSRELTSALIAPVVLEKARALAHELKAERKVIVKSLPALEAEIPKAQERDEVLLDTLAELRADIAKLEITQLHWQRADSKKHGLLTLAVNEAARDRDAHKNVAKAAHKRLENAKGRIARIDALIEALGALSVTNAQRETLALVLRG